MSKKIETTATTKLSKLSQSFHEVVDKKESKIGILTSKKTVDYPVSFRLTQTDIQNLESIVKKINEQSRCKITKSKIIQALIQLGVKIPCQNIIKALYL